jgi:hypothetical protein
LKSSAIIITINFKIFSPPKKPKRYTFITPTVYFPLTLYDTKLLSDFITYLFWNFQVNGNLWHIVFCSSHLLSMFSRFLHVLPCISTSFFCQITSNNIPLNLWIDYILFIHSLVYVYLGFFHLLHIVNSVSKNISYPVIQSLFEHRFTFLLGRSEVLPRSGIAVPNDTYMFYSVRNWENVWQTGWTALYYYQQYMMVQSFHILASTCYYLTFWLYPS